MVSFPVITGHRGAYDRRKFEAAAGRALAPKARALAGAEAKPFLGVFTSRSLHRVTAAEHSAAKAAATLWPQAGAWVKIWRRLPKMLGFSAG